MGKIAFIVLLGLASAASSFAQAWNFQRFMDTPYPKNSGTSGGDLAAADVNGDGKLDLLLSGLSGSAGPATLLYLYSPSAYQLKAETNLPKLDSGSRLILADVDKDGKVDAILTGKTSVDYKNSLMRVYKNQGDGVFSQLYDLGSSLPLEDYEDVPGSWANDDSKIQGISDSAGFSSGFFEAADLNRDGALDIAFSGGKGFEAGTDASGQMIQRDWESSGVFLGDGKGGFSYLSGPSRNDISPAGISKLLRCAGVVADFNADGILDIILAGQANRGPLANAGVPETQRNPLAVTESYLGKGDGSFTRLENSGIDPFIDGSMDYADYNGDGKLDLLVSGNSGHPKDPAGGRILRIYAGKGDGSFSTVDMPSLKPLMSGMAVWGDLDGDKDLDIVAAGNDNSRGLYLYENKEGSYLRRDSDKMKQGLGATSATGASSPDAVTEADVLLADIEGDGDLDIILNGRGGSMQLLVFKNNLKK